MEVFVGGWRNPARKALASLTLLVIWEPWNEHNARVFRHKHLKGSTQAARGGE
jgi:hypothetical protein